MSCSVRCVGDVAVQKSQRDSAHDLSNSKLFFFSNKTMREK